MIKINLCDFDIKMDHLIWTRKPDLVSIKKKRKCQLVDFTVSTDLCSKSKTKNSRNMRTLPLNFKKNAFEYEGDSCTNHSQSTRNNQQKPRKENIGNRNPRKNRHSPDYNTTEII